MQEKFNNKKFRKLIYNGKRNIMQRKKEKAFEKILKDINDGIMMRGLNDGFLKYQQHFGFQMFIDGVSPFKGFYFLLCTFFTSLQCL